MKLFPLVFLLVSCGQTFNSHTNDDKLTSNFSATSPIGILQNKCVNCHTGYHNSWAAYKTDAAWVSSGAVVAGNASNSSIISRLKNVGGDMPKSNPQISDTEYTTLVNWINAL